ncbi:MAG: cyclic nucleotide-binding domain-containing protein [Rhodospirillaceae bacterium]|nr:MAG: cyclic nucleotide-binding domain-containing protein [Rhodospirillaceae bacterium]
MASGPDDHTIEIVAFPKGSVLFKQGDKGEAAYILNSGTVGLYRESLGRRVPLASVRRGEMFGEMAATDGSPRLASAFAIEDSVLMVIPAAAMRDKMRTADPFVKAMIDMLSGNLRRVHETHTPKSRSLLDGVNALLRQCDVIGRFLQANLPQEFKAELSLRLKTLGSLLKEMRRIAMTHREQDRRDDAVPHEADLPH